MGITCYTGFIGRCFRNALSVSFSVCDQHDLVDSLVNAISWQMRSVSFCEYLAPFFLIAKKVKVRSELIQRMLANLTVCGFGIYMIHYFLTLFVKT